MKAHAVVVRVKKPGRDIGPLPVIGVHRNRIEDIETEQLDPIFAVFGLPDAYVRQPADGENLT